MGGSIQHRQVVVPPEQQLVNQRGGATSDIQQGGGCGQFCLFDQTAGESRLGLVPADFEMCFCVVNSVIEYLVIIYLKL